MNSKKKKYPKWFYLVLAAIPVFVLLLLELTLQIFSYGKNLDLWVPVNETQIVLNPEIAYRYFSSTEGIPYPPADPIDIKKDSNSIRIFTVGGSSAAGFPFAPNGTIAKYIKKRFELQFPSKKIEVVNAAMAAVNSYTIRDIVPGLIEQSPDAIVIYAGHNEYYGALGAGSAESLGRNRTVVNALIYLNNFKTYQLLKNFIKSITGIFSDPPVKTGTLMKRMAEEKLIPYNSEIYRLGLEQFENNMTDVIEYCNNERMPLYLCTISSNIKDQPPFVSIDEPSGFPAEKFFNDALAKLTANPKAADSLFTLAKELDALRFRAPEKINEIIRSFSKEQNVNIVDIDSLFKSISGFGIVGNNLMTDHLHPTLAGYKLIGKAIFEKMNAAAAEYSLSMKMDSLTQVVFPFSKLDSTIADFRIRRLKNDWPYVHSPLESKLLRELFKQNSYSDSLAFKIVFENYSWEKAHRKIAEYYLNRGNVAAYKFEYEILIDQFPHIKNYYAIVSKELVSKKYFDDALPYLIKYNDNSPDYFSAKWLGNIYLLKNDLSKSIKYLSECIKFKSDDPQVYYNLAGAHMLNGNYSSASSMIKNCLLLDNNYLGAANLKSKIDQLLKQ